MKSVYVGTEHTNGDETIRVGLLKIVERSLSTDKLCRQFHGIPLALFNTYMKGLEGKFLKRCKLKPKEQLSIVLNKFKSNLYNSQLGKFVLCKTFSS